MSSTQRYSWIITVVDTDQRRKFNPGDAVIIGRTPLRASSVEQAGIIRLNIKDPKKSMSKKHLSLTLNDMGEAMIRDLKSTNGTYVVKPNGELARIPSDRSLMLDESPVRLQLGDVGVILEKVPEGIIEDRLAPVPTAGRHAVDLFAQAQNMNATHADDITAPSVSMDIHDVLDLRAGEPTSAFDAQTVQKRVRVLQTEEKQTRPVSFKPDTATPAQPEASQAEPEVEVEKKKSIVPLPSEAELKQAEERQHKDAAENVTVSEKETSDSVKNDQFSSREEENLEQTIAEQHSHKPEVAPLIQENNMWHARQGSATTVAQQVAAVASTRMTQRMIQPQTSVVQNPVVTPTASSDSATQSGVTPVSYQPQQRRASYQPAGSTGYEPGSVFDRLTRGEYNTTKPAVIIDDTMTSEDAQHTPDQSKQFEMAKHHELLPYLALNPYLYDDLYAWLEAIGDPSIEKALQTNSGYQAFKRKVN